MKKKESKQKRGLKTASEKVTKKTKVSTKAKKVPAKKKVAKGKAKIEKKKTTRKTVKKETKKIQAKLKKKKVAGKTIKKETKIVKVKKEEKAKKKKVAKRTGKKVTPPVEKKVGVRRVTAKPGRKITAKEVALPKKAVPRRQKKVLRPEKEERYPPLPIEILPEEYGEDSIALMIVDPRKLFIYWEVTENAFKKYTGKLNIRLYDVTGIDFDGINAKSYFDTAADNRIGSLYIGVNPEKECIADIGIIDPAGVFTMVARSNKASTPRAEVVEEGASPHRLYETGLPIPPIGYGK
jgi:hypothetical protein